MKIIEFPTFRSGLKFKLFIVFCLLLAGQFVSAQTTRLINFDHLMEALKSGEQVRIIIDYSKCGWQDTTKQSPIPEAITGMDIGTYEYFAPGAIHNQRAFVVFSNTVLIENPIGQGFVYNYGKVRIYEDHSVQVTAKYIHPKRFKVLMNEVFTGKINDGHNGEAIHLFK
jgi:hypothetical protein